MRSVLPALALLCTATATASAATDEEIRQKIVGVWGESPSCAEGRLAFNTDSTFSSENTADASRVEGIYEIAGGKLNGKVGPDSMPEMMVSFAEEALILAGEGGDPNTLVRCAAR